MSPRGQAAHHQVNRSTTMPDDPTPLGDAMSHRFPDQKVPQAKPGSDEASPAESPQSRPALPDHPERMAADIEDEEADPVIDTGPGIADGPRGIRKQRG
jgi:hypothetical protein